MCSIKEIFSYTKEIIKNNENLNINSHILDSNEYLNWLEIDEKTFKIYNINKIDQITAIFKENTKRFKKLISKFDCFKNKSIDNIEENEIVNLKTMKNVKTTISKFLIFFNKFF